MKVQPYIAYGIASAYGCSGKILLHRLQCRLSFCPKIGAGIVLALEAASKSWSISKTLWSVTTHVHPTEESKKYNAAVTAWNEEHRKVLQDWGNQDMKRKANTLSFIAQCCAEMIPNPKGVPTVQRVKVR